jgi:lysophospholipase L1-like esterase
MTLPTLCRMPRWRRLVAALGLTVMLGSTAASAESLIFSQGDRVVLLGATLVEREGNYGWIETRLTARFPELDLTFRNLGWSGDTVFGAARAGFDTEQEGYERLIKHVTDAKPNVILVNYGQVESFDGAAGLEHFLAGLNRLLDDLAPLGARIALLSPTLQENLGAPLPDPTAHNADVRSYAAAIGAVASARGHHFVDFTALLPVEDIVTAAPRTDNGLHFTEDGYWEVAGALMAGLGHDAPALSRSALAPLRALVVEKNRLFFNTWRAQNDTYIFGFRKHEQGDYAEEVPLFLPLVAEQEKAIAALSRQLAGVDQPKGIATP